MEKMNKMGKRIVSFMALLLCAVMLATLLPAGMVSVAAASGDVYSNELIYYKFNDQCYGRYLTPIQTGKYPTVIMICGQGGDATLRSNMRYYMNEWVKAGIFPPMNVVIPGVDDFDGVDGRHFNDFFLFAKKDKMFGTLLEKIETGQLSSQIDTSQDIMLCGFSMGGMCALELGSEFNTRLKKIGALSSAMAFYYGEGRYDGFYPYAADMYYSKDPDSFLFLSCGAAEQSGQFLEWANRYKGAINSSGNNKSDLIEQFIAPSSWGGHEWKLEKKEIFMYLYRCFYGEYPSQSYVESICDANRAPTTPAQRNSDTAHPAPAFTVSPYTGSKLVNLDMSTFVKDTTTDPESTTGSIGNVANTGTLASSTKVKMSSKSGTSFGLDMSKKTFTNKKGATTAYLERKVNSMTTNANNNYMLIDEPALETRANTISFWAKYTPINKQNIEYSFFDYNTTYSGESAPKHLFTFDQKATTESKFVLTGRWANTGRWNDTQYGDITDKAAGKWAQFTITNPAYELNGKKTIKIYVNGEYLYSRVLTKPSGTATSVKLTFGGENSPGQYLYWPDNFTLGNVTVYDGALTSEQVYSEYNLNKDYYAEGTSALPNITGYTFADSTVAYDGKSHNITVTAASGATSGVTTTYTCNGASFTGAVQPGTYNVTAKITKSGYNDLTLNATLKITAPSITGYTFSDSAFEYDGASHMINVAAGSGATSGVTTTYTCNGAAFSGATAVGTYKVTATISKSGYQSLVLTATMTINVRTNPFSHNEYLNLDMTNLVPESFTPTASSVAASSGITKTGSWASGTTLGFSQRPDGQTTLAKGSLQNADGGTTYYLQYNNKVIYPNVTTTNSYYQHLINLQMHNNSFESADNTISFWVDVTKSHVWKEIMCYRVDYTSGGSKAFKSFDLGVNADGTWNALSASTSNNPAGAATNAFSVPNGWKHVVITNPKRSGSKKTMNVYVNGALKKTVTLDIPDGATINRATISFFSKSVGAFGTDADGKANGPWRTREAIAASGKIGDFKIYQGALSASEVTDEYYGGINRYTEGSGTPVLQNITGYTFSNSTVTYDGANHMINVAAGSNATSGVTTTYTCNGASFSGAAQPGTYNVTATLKKSGYKDLTLSATLTINKATIKGYTFADSTVTYDGNSHMINVAAGSNATQGVTTTYKVNGASFTGAKDVGTYPVTATIKKTGYNDLTLNATLTIEEIPAPYHDGDVLVDLDMSTYVKDTETDPKTVSTSIGGIANSGTLNSSTVVKMSSKAGMWNALSLTKEAFQNAEGGETSYLHRTINDPACNDRNFYTLIEEKTLEEGANTISFWAKYVPENRSGCYYTLLDYNVTYDGEADPEHLFSLGQEMTTTGKFTLTGRWSPVYADITDEAAGKWAHYVITNPEYENGSKTMKVYVNGVLRGSKVVTQPSGNVTAVKIAFAGEQGPTNIIYWPTDFSLGDVRVTGGVMSDSEIAAEYSGSKNKYLKPIAGYTFSDETVTYDAKNHMINVAADSDATQDVTTTYTVDGEAFSGAKEIGTYPITATIKKPGYSDLTLDATLTIEKVQAPYNDGDVVMDLDMSTYVEDTETDPLEATESIGSITNSGVLDSSTVVKMSSKAGMWNALSLTKETFQNAEGGLTSYLHRTINDPACNDRNFYTLIEEKALEEGANTISFWAKYVPENRSGCYYTLLDYNVTYDDDGEENPEHLFYLGQEMTTTGKFNLTGRWSPVYADITDEAAGKWAHYVITNPEYVDDTKTMKIYVNGELKGSKVVTRPTGNVTSVKLAFAGEQSPKDIIFWPTEFSLGNVRVVGGIMSDSEIAAEYYESVNRYTES